MQGDGGEDGSVGLRDGAQKLRGVAGEGADEVDDDDASGGEPRAHELDELDGGEVEGDRVCVVRIDGDDVPAGSLPAQVTATVLDVDSEACVVRQREPAVRGLDDIGVELDDLQLQIGEVAPHPLLRGAAAEADEQDAAGARIVGEAEVEVVGVTEACAEGVVEVHPALEGVVEAQVPRVGVVDDEQSVVARVSRLAQREAVGERGDGCRVEPTRSTRLPNAVDR